MKDKSHSERGNISLAQKDIIKKITVKSTLMKRN